VNNFVQVLGVAATGLIIGLAAERFVPRSSTETRVSIRGAGTIPHHSLHKYCPSSLACDVAVMPVLNADTCTADPPTPVHAHPAQVVIWKITPVPGQEVVWDPRGVVIDNNLIDANVGQLKYFYKCEPSGPNFKCTRNQSGSPAPGQEGKSNVFAYTIYLTWNRRLNDGTIVPTECKVDPLIVSRG
jgi:hypothetical protein